MQEYERVVGDHGLQGIILGPSDAGPDDVAIELDDGREISVPASNLTRRPDGAWYVRETTRSEPLSASGENGETIVPVLAEQLEIGVRKKPVSTVRVQKHVTEHDEAVAMPLEQERAEVKRVLINRPVDGPLPIRREGDTIIMPVVEEVPVVEKRLVLKEEIHVTRRRRTEQYEDKVTLRREHVEVSRHDTEGRPLPVSVDSPETDREPTRRISEDDPALPLGATPGILGPRPPTRIRRNKIIKED